MDFQNKKILVLNGDKRQKYVATYLENEGYDVEYEELADESQSHNYDVIIGTIPFGDKDIQKYRGVKVVFGGCISRNTLKYCEENNIVCHDLMQDEKLTEFNAIATAEGAIAEAVMANCVNIRGSRSVVIGYGKCGSQIAHLLEKMGAKVTVCVRNHEVLQEVYKLGMGALEISQLSRDIRGYQYIFNTVPYMIITEDVLGHMDRAAVIIDIASKPGGVDYEAADRLGIEAKLCLGLPGKYSPKSSAEGIVECIKRL